MSLPKPYYEDEYVTLYHEDCRDILPLLAGVQLIVTSPPYNKMGLGAAKRAKISSSDNVAWKKCLIHYGDFDDDMPEPEYQEWQRTIVELLYDVLAQGGSLFYNHKHRIRLHRVITPLQWLTQTRFELVQEIVWDRGSTPAIKPVRFYPTTERIYWLTKGTAAPVFNADYARFMEVWRVSAQTSTPHPAPMPLEIASRCVGACSSPSDVVLDPYAGGGTTLVAAKALGRKAIGIELDEQWCALSAQRLSQNVLDFGGVA